MNIHFTEYQLKKQLKKWLEFEINECEKRIKHEQSKYLLENVLAENLMLAGRAIEVFNFKLNWLKIQLDKLEHPWLSDKKLSDRNKSQGAS